MNLEDSLVQHIQQFYDGHIFGRVGDHDINANIEERLRSLQQRWRNGWYGISLNSHLTFCWIHEWLFVGTRLGWRIRLEAGSWRRISTLISCDILLSTYWKWLSYHLRYDKCHSFNHRRWTVYRVRFIIELFPLVFAKLFYMLICLFLFFKDEVRWSALEFLCMLPRHQ